MAVSGKTAGPHEIPYFLDGDTPPNMSTVTKAMADRLHILLNERPPNNSVYRTLLSGKGMLFQTIGSTSTFLLGSIAGVNSQLPYAANGSGELAPIEMLGSPTTARVPPEVLDFDDADFAVAGKLQRMRLRVHAIVNATAPEHNLAFSVFPLEANGGAEGKLATKIGAAVASSTVTLNAPGASAIARGVTADFAVPADGLYVVGVKPSANMNNKSVVMVSAQLQHRNV